MDPASSPERLRRLKQRYPHMDLEMVQFFAGTIAAIHDIASLMEVHFSQFGLSKGRFMVLIHLHQEPDPQGTSISEVLSTYRVSSATMTGLIDTLETEGLLERIKSPEDRRRVNIRLTPAGRRFLDDFLPKHHAYLKLFTTALDTKERDTLAELLAKLRGSIAEGLKRDIDPKGGTP